MQSSSDQQETVSQMEDIKQNETETELNSKMLHSKYSLFKEEIDDFMDENPTNQTLVSADDVEVCIEKVTQLRSKFRGISKDIENILGMDQYNSTYTEEICTIMASMKEYIINAKDGNQKSENLKNMLQFLITHSN